MNLHSKLWQNLTMFLVLGSFVMANFGWGKSTTLWMDGWEGIGTLLGLGVGMKMVKDQVDKNNVRKNSKMADAPTKVDNPDA